MMGHAPNRTGQSCENLRRSAATAAPTGLPRARSRGSGDAWIGQADGERPHVNDAPACVIVCQTVAWRSGPRLLRISEAIYAFRGSGKMRLPGKFARSATSAVAPLFSSSAGMVPEDAPAAVTMVQVQG